MAMCLVLLAAVLGNAATATKLQTARSINGTNFDGTGNITTTKWGTTRNIALTGAVTGNANVDGSGNVTITTTQANIAVITGNLDANGYAEISYPTGFSKDNSVVLFAGFHGTSQVSSWAYGANFDSSSVVSGAIPCQMTFGDKIKVWLRNIQVAQDGSVAVQAISRVYPYKIVLMKVS